MDEPTIIRIIATIAMLIWTGWVIHQCRKDKKPLQ